MQCCNNQFSIVNCKMLSTSTCNEKQNWEMNYKNMVLKMCDIMYVQRRQIFIQIIQLKSKKHLQYLLSELV